MSARPPVLLYVVNVSWFFLSHRLPLAVAALRSGYEVHLATAVSSEADRRRILNAGIVLHDVTMSRSSAGLLDNAVLLMTMWKLYRRLKPDVVHHVTMKPNVIGGYAARLSGVPCVVAAVSGLGYAFVARGFRATLRRKALAFAMRGAFSHRNCRVIVQNPDDRDALVGARVIPMARTELIRGAGVDPCVYRSTPEPDGVVRVLMASRLLREKGVPEFVEAAKRLRASGVSAEFLLAGDLDPASPGSVTQSEMARWARDGNVVWMGHVDDMMRLLSEVHVVCLPSYYGEGVPKVLIEAAAAGRAIVATDTPGCREIARHGVNASLVPARDVGALTAALHSLIGDPAVRARYGQAGRDMVIAEYSLQRVIEKTLTVYEELREAVPQIGRKQSPLKGARKSW